MSLKKAIIILLILTLVITVVMAAMYFNFKKQEKFKTDTVVAPEHKEKQLTPEQRKQQLEQAMEQAEKNNPSINK